VRTDPRLLALAGGNFALGSASMSIIGLLNEISRDLDVSIAQAGQIVTASHVVAAFLAPVIAVAASRLQRRTVLLLALGTGVLAQFASAFATGFWLLFVARLLFGVCIAAHAPTAVATSGLLAEPGQRGRAVSLVMAGFALATVVGIPLGVWFGGIFGWRATMMATTVVIMVPLIGIWMLIPKQLPLTQLDMSAWGNTLKNSGVRATLLIALLMSLGQMAFFSYVAPLLHEAIDAGPGTIAIMLSLSGVSSVIGSFLGMRLMDRLTPIRVIRIACILVIVPMALWPFTHDSVTVTVILIMTWGAGGMLIFTAVSAQMLLVSQQLATVSMALNTSVIFLGNVLGTAIGGVLITLIGLHALPWMTVIVYSGILIVLPAIRREMKRSH